MRIELLSLKEEDGARDCASLHPALPILIALTDPLATHSFPLGLFYFSAHPPEFQLLRCASVSLRAVEAYSIPKHRR